MDFVIKKATKKDASVILTFIRELAQYEKLLHEVKADEKLLLKTMFGKKRYAECIIAYLDKKPIGFALYFFNFSTFLGKPGIYLEDLYIRKEHRGKGYGKELLKYLARLARKKEMERVDWWVLDWNKNSIDFYNKIGARPMNEWTVFRMTGKALDEMAK
jgi:GNAT superfamily N-acetyltransferase